MWVEHLIQGERPARIRLYKQPWNTEKIFKLGATHLIWVLTAFWTAFTFTAYFTFAPQLFADFFTGQAHPTAYLTVFILSVSTYVAAGLAREQICTYICPYGRFQSVMYDPETLAVAYDEKRGEGQLGRASLRSGMKTLTERHAQQHGDCIDCGLCVQVCPAGIDIRNGLQYSCISCGLCIDACNSIMTSVGFPRGLIRYDAEKNLKQAQPTKPKLHWQRLKVMGYGVAFLAMSGLLTVLLANRSDFDHAVTQVRSPLYVLLSDGAIRNRYQLRISNRANHEETFRLGVRGIPEAAADFGNFKEVTLKSGKSLMVQVSVKLAPAQAAKVNDFEFTITPRSRPLAQHLGRARFYAKDVL